MKAETVGKINFIRMIIVFALVLALGIVFLVLAVKLNQQTVPEDYVEVEALISRIEEEHMPGFDVDDPSGYEYRVFVTYTYGGTTYSDREYGNYSSSMKEGDPVKLYLDPNDPDTFISDPSGSFVFLIISAVVVLVGAGGLIFTLYKKKGA